MLEHSLLVVHGWIRQTDGAWVRPVTDAAIRALGLVRFEGTPRGSWASWLHTIRLEVFETDDASHLMTLTRSWGVLGSWQVDDAEGRHVGNLYAKTIVTSENVRLGYLDATSKTQGRVVDLAGRTQAHFSRNEGPALGVAFAPDAVTNPFVRMLVLASILTLEPRPNGS